MNKAWRCTYALFSVNLPGEYGREGKWSKADCTENAAFICQVQPAAFTKECDDRFSLRNRLKKCSLNSQIANILTSFLSKKMQKFGLKKTT